MRKIQLTPNFNLNEFIRPQDPMPPQWIIDNLYFLANRLQVVRDIIGKPIVITSGYRTPEHNKAVGGSSQSFHMKGMAVDFLVPGMTPDQVREVVKNWSGGVELGIPWVHLDIGPKRRFYP